MRASEITPQAVHWLWYPYIPLGKITAAAGQMGQAKSLLTVWLAAAVTTGEGVNDNRDGSVVMLNAEDDAEDTIWRDSKRPARTLTASGSNRTCRSTSTA